MLIQTPIVSGNEMGDANRDSRHFRFSYGAKITDQPPGAKVSVWFPVPTDDHFQNVEIVSSESPGVLHFNFDHRFANKIGYFESKIPDSGQIEFSMVYDVERREADHDGAKIDQSTRDRFLAANRLVPTGGAPVQLLKETKLESDSLKRGSQLYEIVEQYMSYDKTKPGYGNGDVLWACSSKTGNCTDFHSLFISLARNQGLPARFEIGFPLPADKKGRVKGYHCWAWFHANDVGWVPVDISEADKHPELKKYYFGKLSPDRIAFSTGRDIELVPRSASPALNYFVYPHVEVTSQSINKKLVQLDFSFADIASNKKTAAKK